MIKAEYLRFLRTLDSGEVLPGVRKLANLVLTNLDELASLGTYQGQRVKKMVALAQTNWDTLGIEIQSLPDITAEKTSPITQIKSMAVGPFRGFSRQEIFDLESRLVLIYGPNGTGKSSFCEALEYSLLGSVAEAESKRFRDHDDYLKNAHVNRFASPVVTGLNEQGAEVVIEANEELFRFCFAEKNRIDNFSRIAAQAPAKQTELISTLFGLDSFNEFVRNFTSEFDPKYIDLTCVKAAQLEQKRQALSGSQQQIATNKAELQKLNIEEQALATQYRDGATFSQLVFELNGDDENSGAIQKLETDLQQPQASKTNLTISALQTLGSSIRSGLSELELKQKDLENASQEVSFKNLYDAVIQLQPSSPEHCPACKTPLTQVSVNPYGNASEELQKLHYLAELQRTVQQLQQNVSRWLLDLSQILNVCLMSLPQNNAIRNFHISPNSQVDIGWWHSLQQRLADGLTPWQHLEYQVKHLEEADKKTDQDTPIRSAKRNELNRLRCFKEKITILETRSNTAKQAIIAAQQAITSFDTENVQLIADVDAEHAKVQKNQEIAVSYKSFVERLNAYKNRLPSQLVADLGDLVVRLYNAFNRYDSEADQLASVQLPLSQNQRLGITFLKDPSVLFDALHILSEGHIRCLGLAILLAKNIKECCPVLIFDDPVNAIDDEHRRAIRETLFVDDFFKGCQIILAVHGEEFFNNTHQLLGKSQSHASQSYIFLSSAGEDHIQVDSLKRPKNYVLAARELYAQGEYRDALMSARRALENLCEKTWFHYGKHSDKKDSLISVSRRSPSAPWDLRALAENLKSKLNRSQSKIPNKEPIVSALTTVLGQNGRDAYWSYLNKGTHEETDLSEFDQHTVNEVISALESLDAALSETN
ncbi:AAA family ATPase [Microbulbifer epialgicus]|uniref:AAA family ATPase n=1 Tax=Microbulbifer epialgicus TaxID=393907 RepID=A0ABV4NZY8_9GAMM